ncbi:MAG: tight adherence protein B [Chloroflexi bacterium]|nr:MAG: tight adherence protein B [Chloroflexota bacterium]MBA4376422.1 hypothetical protein [Anaerolinea sp.]
MDQNTITIILLIILLLSAAGIFLIGIWLFRHGPSSKLQGRISRFVEPMDQAGRGSVGEASADTVPVNSFSQIRDWINDRLSIISSEKLQLKLSSAYWPVTDTEFILIRMVAAIIGFTLGWLIPGNVFGGVFLGALLMLIPPIILDRAIGLRQHNFQNQLLDVLVMIKGAVQAGYSLSQALDMTVKELTPPSSEEFSRVLREVRFGFPFEQALNNLSERMESDDLQIVVTAIIINAQVGGNLSTVLEATIYTIRERMHLFSEIRSLSSYARYVGSFLTLLPFITGFIIFIVTPDYFENVFISPITQFIFILALIGILAGNFWIRRIVKIRV